MGVIIPTNQLQSQFVAVDAEAIAERAESGAISTGYNQGMGPQLKPNEELKITTNTTTNLGVALMFTNIDKEIHTKANPMRTLPVNNIGLRPHLSTKIHGGNVEMMYMIPLKPVIKSAFLPTQPAFSKTKGA